MYNHSSTLDIPVVVLHSHSTKMDRWIGKVALVTGVSSGIGECIAKHLVSKGMKVVGLGRRIERLKKLEEDVKGGKGELKCIQCDVTDIKKVQSVFEWVEKNWGAVDVLINNAAVLKLSTLADSDIVSIDQMFKTNVVAVSSCAKEALKSMKKHNNEGCIININSVAGHTMPPMLAVGGYSSTKYALTVMTEYLRNEVATFSKKIRVTSLSPGLVKSEMSGQFGDKLPSDMPILSGNDIANCVEFVLSCPTGVNITEMIVQPTGESLMALSSAINQ